MAIEYAEIDSEMMRADGALAREMRGHNARDDARMLLELASIPASQIQEPRTVRKLRNSSGIHKTKRSKAIAGRNYF